MHKCGISAFICISLAASEFGKIFLNTCDSLPCLPHPCPCELDDKIWKEEKNFSELAREIPQMG